MPCFGESSGKINSEFLPGNTSSGRSEPFVVKMINGRIKECAGCKGPHLKNSDNGLLSPPLDICICHKEPLPFINPRMLKARQCLLPCKN